MTDRYAGFLVTLEHETREDDAEPTIAAIRQIKGVVSVTPMVANGTYAMALERAKADLRAKLREVLWK